jgi:hypothetical protein
MSGAPFTRKSMVWSPVASADEEGGDLGDHVSSAIVRKAMFCALE